MIARSVFFIILLLNTSLIIAQKVECRNDSIFINGFYINASTSKMVMDSILKGNGKIKQQLDHHRSTANGPKTITNYTYKKLGLIFRKYDYDSTKISIVLKLSKNSTIETQRFTGDIVFANSHINEIKRLDQVQGLQGCRFTYYSQPIKVPGYPLAGAYAATVRYQKSSMYVVSDFFIDEITAVTITDSDTPE